MTMSNTLLTFLLISCFSSVSAQEFQVEIREIRDEGQIQIVASNHEIFPVTVELSLSDIKNLDVTDEDIALALQGKVKDQTLAILRPAPGKTWNYKLKYRLHFGDVLMESFDEDYIYHLPYEKGKSYIVSQGYNGRLSHTGENALDFDMEIGTKICAARAGIVIKVVEEHNRSCPDVSCNDFSNQIVILHSDGTMSEYAHLKQNGAFVEVGQSVSSGELIGLSGNTGWTTGPHLHFTVFRPTLEGRETIRTVFNTGKEEGEYLKELKTYRAF